MSKQAIIIFVKNPIEGNVKTRLAATIGNKAAVTVYEQLLLHTASITKSLTCDKFVFYGDYVNEQDVWANEFYQKQQQQGFDLGERMFKAFEYVISLGYERVAIIGSDCYELTTEILANAFDTLFDNDVVIGPCNDGGYYLLGIKKLYHQVFQNINWSTDTVLSTTIQICKNLQLQHKLLLTLNDVDDEATLPDELRLLIG